MWFIYALIAAALWGLNYSLTERLLSSLSTATLLAIEMLIGGVLFLVIAYFTNLKDDIITLTTETKVLGLVLCEIAIVIGASYFITASIKSKNATVAGMIELIYPLFTILFTWLVFRNNHVDLKVMLGGGLILAGVVVISFT